MITWNCISTNSTKNNHSVKKQLSPSHEWTLWPESQLSHSHWDPCASLVNWHCVVLHVPSFSGISPFLLSMTSQLEPVCILKPAYVTGSVLAQTLFLILFAFLLIPFSPFPLACSVCTPPPACLPFGSCQRRLGTGHLCDSTQIWFRSWLFFLTVPTEKHYKDKLSI